MTKYTQINYEERIIIADLYKRNSSYYYIAKWLNRKYDTIKEEVERNGRYNKYKVFIYSANIAHKKYLQRRKESKEDYRIIENNIKLEKRIIKLIKEDQLSPEEIAGRYNTVSQQTIYNWMHRMKDISLKKELVKNLRRKGKKYRKASKLAIHGSKIAPKTMIDQRSEIINNRERLGDLEGDTVLLNGLERLYTLVDRKSGYLFLKHILDGKAETIHQETIDIFNRNKNKIKSITYDNGVEFSYHDLIHLDTNIPIYFCFPYHSWERGTNENTNGLLRQYYPKKVIHGIITKRDIKIIEKKLNNRPRKRLNYLTPYEVFIKKMKPENFQVQSII
jgi:transposase, IS30 family